MAKGKTPQDVVSDFWKGFVTSSPGKVTTIFPDNLYKTLLPRPHATDSGASQTNFGAGYEAAANECRNKVARIVRDCMRANTKFSDPDFDLRAHGWDCLVGLTWTPPTVRAHAGDVEEALGTLQENKVFGDVTLPIDVSTLRKVLAGKPVDDDDDDDDPTEEVFNPNPQAVHRVDWIYEDPQFEVDGFSSSDILQGANSADCWWLSAVATICHRRELMDKMCVARNEACGVYGFVFYRDGAWISTVVDDNLFLARPDFGAAVGGDLHDPTNSAMRKYRRTHQTGSEALYFAACRDANETWLPLLEKAYAKAHGDYHSIFGGWVGEGVEDLTGGVNSEMVLEDVLFKDALWMELLNEEKHFVFGLDILDQSGVESKNGLANAHAYSLLEAREEAGEDGKRVRLVKIRNPWGERGADGIGEWNGPWSDGSKEWSPYWLNKLNYRFENDGVFWMTYADMLGTFTNLYRTRLFDDAWTVTQEWTAVNVAWLTGYLQKKFIVEVKQTGTAVFVLQQLDTRYFRGLEGQYTFLLHFILQKRGSPPGEYLCRVRPRGGSSASRRTTSRSVSCEVEGLEPGVYEVLPKITAHRHRDRPPVDRVVSLLAERKPLKLRQVGLSFDLAHAKALRADLARDEAAKKAGAGEGAVEGSDTVDSETKGDGEDVREDEDEEREEETEEESGTEEEEDDEEEEDGESDPKEAVEENEAEKKEAEEEDAEGGEVLYEAIMEQGGGFMSGMGLQEEEEDSDGDDDPNSKWNAVCVIGLRVYSQDPGVSVRLADPRDAEEASSVNPTS